MKIKLTEAVTADQIRQSMSGFVGPKFAKTASDEDIMKMVDLKDKIAKHHNTHILPIQKQIDALYKQYKIKSNKGIEESTSINEISFEDTKTFYVTVKVILDWGLPLLTLATIIAGVGVIKAIDLVKQGKDAFMKKYNQLKNAVDTNKVKKIEVKLKSFKDKKVESTSMNEGVITIALGVAGGLILLRILAKLLKTILSGIGMNVKLSKERLIEVTETMMDAALKQVVSGKGGMQGSDFMAFVYVKQYIIEQINSGKVNTIKDIVNIIKLAEKGKLNVKESKSQR